MSAGVGSGAPAGVVRATLDVPPSEELKTGGRMRVTLLPAAVAGTAEQNVLSGVARVNPALRERAAALITSLKAVEPQVMTWLRESDENARQFALDPVAALRAARISPALVAELDGFVHDLVKKNQPGRD